MTPAQQHLRAAIRQLQDRRRVTTTALAQAMGCDESYVRRMLSDQSDIRIEFERHLLPWARLLGLSPSALVFLHAQAHGLTVDVTDHQPGTELPDALLGVAALMAQAGEMAKLTGEALADGVVTTPEAAAIDQAGAELARRARSVAATASAFKAARDKGRAKGFV